MTTSFEIANFIILQLESKQETLSGMALQRYIFLLDGAHILRHNEKLIDEDFTIGNYGPVVKVLNDNIPERGAFIPLKDHRRINELTLEPEYKSIIHELPKAYAFKQEIINDLNHIVANMSSSELIDAFYQLKLNKEYGIMFEADIRNFFVKNPEFQIWNA